MSSSGYTAITFVADELLTSTKMNQMAANDASFNNGNGFEDAILLTRHFANLQVLTKHMKPTFAKYDTGNGGSRQTITGATTAALGGLSQSYTSGPTAERLFILAECIVQLTSPGAQLFIAVGGTAVGKSSYGDTTGGYFKHIAYAYYDIAANTTVTIAPYFKNISGTATVANSNSDQTLSPSYGQSLSIQAFGR